MINFDEVTEENTQEHNPHWPQVSDHPHKILTADRFGSGKMNALLNLINN